MTEFGEDQRVREMRLFFQHTCEANFRESVERITGRKVRAFTSGTDTVRTCRPKCSTWSPKRTS